MGLSCWRAPTPAALRAMVRRAGQHSVDRGIRARQAVRERSHVAAATVAAP